MIPLASPKQAAAALKALQLWQRAAPGRTLDEYTTADGTRGWRMREGERCWLIMAAFATPASVAESARMLAA